MSGILASQVWKYKLDKTSLVVLMALCDIADDDGTSCYPRPRYVAWKTGSSVATVYRMIEKFTDMKVLEQVGWRGETPEYIIHLEKLGLKPDFERKRNGRPRKNLSHHEKSFSPREKKRTTRKVSQDEKTFLTMRKPFSPRENLSHHENEERRLSMPENEAESGVVSKRDVPESLLLNHSYDPILEIHNASTKNEKENVAETAEAEAEADPTPYPLPARAEIAAAVPDSDLAPAVATWVLAQEAIKRSMTPAQYQTCVRGAQLFTAAHDHWRYILIATTPYTAEQLRSRFYDRIRAALESVARGPFAGLEVRSAA